MLSAFLSQPSTKLSIAFFAVSILTCGVPASSQVTYTITDLGALFAPQTYGPAYGLSINASGDVAGSIVTTSGQIHAAVFHRGKVLDLGVLPGGEASVSSGINGYGEVTGYVQFPSPVTPSGSYTRAFLYKAGMMKDLGVLPGDENSAGVAINDSGQVAGSSAIRGVLSGPSFQTEHGFLYTEGTMANVAAPSAGALETNAFGINAAGEIAGDAMLPGDVEPHASVFNHGDVTELKLSISPSFPSYAFAFNDLGDVTGWLYHDDDKTDAFLTMNNVRVSIGTLPAIDSLGSSINASGAFVGTAYGPTRPMAFLYTPRKGFTNLNLLLPAASGWMLGNVEAINDKGQITGMGTTPSGSYSAYLLSPVFAPFRKLKTEIDLSDTKHEAFAARGRFALDKKSNGIDPLTETLVLQLGGYHLAIPPSSFVKTHGAFFYRGDVGKVEVEAIIWQASAGVFLFEIRGKGAAGLPRICLESVSLTIGDDSGTEQMKDSHGRSCDCPSR